MRSNAPPGLRNKPGWSTFLIAFVTKWYSFLIAFLGRVAWFFNSAGGLVFFEHWPSFFLTFAFHSGDLRIHICPAPEVQVTAVVNFLCVADCGIPCLIDPIDG